MISEELNNKYLTDEILEDYFLGQATDEEKFIIESLKDIEENRSRFSAGEELYKNINLIPLSSAKKIKISNLSQIEIHRHEARAGEIWRVKRIPAAPLNDKKILPAATYNFIYLLTSPEAAETGNDSDLSKEYPELFSLSFLPISFDIQFATHKDILFPANNDILGLPFMIMTDIEKNTIVANLDKKIGSLEKEKDNEVLNVYFKTNKMKYDDSVLERTSVGNFTDDDYGDLVDYRPLIDANFDYLEESYLQLNEFFHIDEMVDYSSIISENISLAASDESSAIDYNLAVPKNEKIIFEGEFVKAVLQVFEDGVPILKIYSDNLDVYKDAFLKISIKELKESIDYKVDFSKPFNMFMIDKRIKNHSVEFSLTADDMIFFIKFLKF